MPDPDRSEGAGKPKLAVYSSLQRGWFFGSQHFKEQLLERLKGIVPQKKPGGRIDATLRKDHGERRGNELIRAGLTVFGISAEDLRAEAKGDWRKGILAEMIQRETTLSLDWISVKLTMGDRSS